MASSRKGRLPKFTTGIVLKICVHHTDESVCLATSAVTKTYDFWGRSRSVGV